MERSIGISANLGVKGISANLGVKGISGNFLGIHRSSEKHKGVQREYRGSNPEYTEILLIIILNNHYF